jgi:DNA-binding IclR family transcriptional regulator
MSKPPLSVSNPEARATPPAQIASTPKAALANTTADRAIDVLLAFSETNPTWSVAELSERFDMPRSTTYRYLKSLRSCALVVEDEDNRYRLGPRLIQMAHIARSGIFVIQVAAPFLQQLSERFGELILLKERRGDEMITIDRLECTHQVALMSTKASLFPWPAAPSAKVFLAYANETDLKRWLEMMSPVGYTNHTVTSRKKLITELDLIRRRGFACSEEELDEGVIGFAAPIFDNNICRYTLSIAAPAYRWPSPRRARLIDALKSAAAAISSALSGF